MIELPEPTYHESGATDYHGNLLAYTARQLRTYGDQRAAEAREQMREECIKLFPQPHVEYHGDAIVIAIERLP